MGQDGGRWTMSSRRKGRRFCEVKTESLNAGYMMSRWNIHPGRVDDGGGEIWSGSGR